MGHTKNNLSRSNDSKTTDIEKELLADNNLKNYNNIYYLVEKAETLFIEEEDI